MEALSSPAEEFNRSFRESLRRSSPSPVLKGRQHYGSSSSLSSKQSATGSLKPDAVSIEKVVSPVIEHTLQQQQLLLQQQQALIELQKDQQQIQKALQDQLKLQTLQTQMQIEQQNKAQPAQALVAKKTDVVTTGTSMSIPSTPKTETRDWKSDRRVNMRSPDGRERSIRSERHERHERHDRHERDDRLSPPQRKYEPRDWTPERRDYRRRDDSLSPERMPLRDRRPERGNNKKDRRRLPQPTVEEIQGAVEAISGSHSLAVSSLTRSKSRSPTAAILKHQSAVLSSSPPIVPAVTALPAANIAVLDSRSLSPGLLIASYPVQVVSPAAQTFSTPVRLLPLHLLFPTDQ